VTGLALSVLAMEEARAAMAINAKTVSDEGSSCPCRLQDFRNETTGQIACDVRVLKRAAERSSFNMRCPLEGWPKYRRLLVRIKICPLYFIIDSLQLQFNCVLYVPTILTGLSSMTFLACMIAIVAASESKTTTLVAGLTCIPIMIVFGICAGWLLHRQKKRGFVSAEFNEDTQLRV
jgi:uncharacterized membrane protein